MKLYYHVHQSSNSYNDHSWYEEDWNLCDTEEEYQELLVRYKIEVQEKREDYISRGYGSYAPQFHEENELHASEYYYGHEWTGKNFDAVGFCYTVYHERGSYKHYYLKPDSVKNVKFADNSHCAGWMYGS